MTTKTIAGLIIAGVLVGSAAAGVQVIDPPLTSGQGTSTTKVAGCDAVPFLAILPSPERFASASTGAEQATVRVVRLTR